MSAETKAKTGHTSPPFLRAFATSHPVLKACLLSGLAVALLFIWVMKLHWADLAVPFTYQGDALHVLSLVKGFYQGDWIWYNSHLAAPFGADMRDFPLSMTADLVVMKALSLVISQPSAVANLYWMLSLVAAGVITTYCLLRLRFPYAIAIACGVIYALQPFAFARGIGHISLVFHLVPLLATGATELAIGTLSQASSASSSDSAPLSARTRLRFFSGIPSYLIVGCCIQGFAHIYNSFFACFFFATAGLIAYGCRRRRSDVITALVLIVLICLGTGISLVPSAYYWHENGRNPALLYKNPAEADVYGLKLRTLVTPIWDHPVPLLRRVSDRFQNAHFPLDANESVTARLGTVGAVGFLVLLAVGILAIVSGGRIGTPLMRGSAGLTYAGVLLAGVGGFGSIFNVFVAPDIRCYNRISVFIGYFAIVAAASLLSSVLEWMRRKGIRNLVGAPVLCIFVLLAVRDEASSTQYLNYEARRAEFSADERFVGLVESVLPPGSMVFQLPHTDFPLDAGTGKMGPYDHARAYIHSQTLKWSWEGISGRGPDLWNRAVAGEPVDHMLADLSRVGFQGIYLDRFGYADSGAAIEGELRRILGIAPIETTDGRELFFSLVNYAGRMTTTAGSPSNQSMAGDLSRLTTYQWGEPLLFDSDPAHAARLGLFLRDGWCPQEVPRFRWTIGKVSTLELFVEPTGQDQVLSILVVPNGIPYHRLPVIVKVDGSKVGEWNAVGSESFSMKIPGILLANKKRLILTFEMPEARSLRDLGAGNDPRMLGLAVREIRIGGSDSKPQMQRPAEVAWGAGAYQEETGKIGTWHWCPAACEIVLVNPSPTPAHVRITFGISTGYAKPARFAIKGPGISEIVPATDSLRTLVYTLDLPPGKNVFKMSCDAPRVPVPGDTRNMVFMVSNLSANQVSGDAR
jgi:phosphoglycerol transferase